MFDDLETHKASDAYPAVSYTVLQFIEITITASSPHWNEYDWMFACIRGDRLAMYIINHQPPFDSLPAKYRYTASDLPLTPNHLLTTVHRLASKGNQVAEPNPTQEHAQDANIDDRQTEISNEDIGVPPAGDSAPLQQASVSTSTGASSDQPLASPASILDPAAQAGGDASVANPLRSPSNAAPAMARSPSVHSLGIGQHLHSVLPFLDGESSSPGGGDINMVH